MNIKAELQGRASDLVQEKTKTIAALEKELRGVEQRKSMIESQLHAANMATKRLLDFRPMIGADYQCPDCFIKNETRSAMRPIPAGPSGLDLFKCVTCEAVFEFPD